MQRFLAAVVAVNVLAAGCAYVGDPLPPLANIPGTIADLTAAQRGSHIVVRFTLPTLTAEKMPIKGTLTPDLRIGGGVEPFDADQWSAQAKQIPPVPVKDGVAEYLVDSTEFAGKAVTIAARVSGQRGKTSLWSNFQNLLVVAPPAPPSGLEVRGTATGVLIAWQGAAGEFRVSRRSGDEKNFAAVQDVSGNSWTDAGAEYGKTYTYQVERVVKLGIQGEAMSEPSEAKSITPRDTFPPAAPAGLAASAAPNSIELSWERNSESDLSGFRIYRAEGGGAFEKIADTSSIPAYSDRTAQRGKTYRYAVAAFDQAGNEGSRSNVVEAALPE